MTKRDIIERLKSMTRYDVGSYDEGDGYLSGYSDECPDGSWVMHDSIAALIADIEAAAAETSDPPACERCRWWTGDAEWQGVKAGGNFAIHACASPRMLQRERTPILTERGQACLVDSDYTVFDAALVTGPDFACAFFLKGEQE